MDQQKLAYDFESSIGYWITMTSHSYQQALNDELAPYGITFRQFQVLAWLAYDGELSQGELARRMMIEPPTLVGILDRMQREGWIQRQSCSVDRRRKRVALRAPAEAVWSKVVGCLTRVRHRATKGMSPQEVELLSNLLSKVQSNLGEVAPRDVNSMPTAGVVS
jgi:MarR family transcriptional regulator for hemolysin